MKYLIKKLYFVNFQLPETSFINLEESSFEYQLLTITDGRGVDVIFDILNSHKRYLFLDALAHNGRLVEFEKNTLFNESLGKIRFF